MEKNKKKDNKNSLLNKLSSFFGFKRSEVVNNRRGFNIASRPRLNGSFFNVGTDINSVIYKDNYKLMQFVRDYELNNPYVRKFLNLMVNNVVGPTGFNLYIKAFDYKRDENGDYVKVLDVLGNKVVNDGFWEWAKRKNCDITQTYNFIEIQEMAVRQLFRDGESLIIKHKGGKELNKFGFALQLINIERLDRNYTNVTAKNGNRVCMGIELDKNNRRVAYYIKKNLNTVVPGAEKSSIDGSNYERIASEDCIYLFRATDAEQIRGYSPLVAGLETLEQLSGYQEAELVNARASAAKMGFFISNSTNVDRLDIADSEDSAGNFISEVEPGTFHVLPNGYDYKENNPNYPQTFDKFVKTTLRTVASAFNVSYESLANDREGVSYSSIRAGLVEDRETFKAIQNFIIENMLDDIYEEWLKNSILNKAIVFPNGQPLPFEKFEKFKTHIFRGRGFAWVDPLKDISASVEAIKFGLSSRQRECEKLGVDLYEIFDELAEEKKLAESKGIHLDNSENVLAKLSEVQKITEDTSTTA